MGSTIDSVPRSRRRAFSMVELLVVVGIIAVLISLLLPTLSKARGQAMTTQCAAQLRQLGQAILLYADNNAGYTPTWSAVHYYVNGQMLDINGAPDTELSWTELLIPYLGKPDSRIYRCPAFPDDCVDYFIAARWEYANGQQRNIQLSNIKLSTCFVLSGDCTAAGYHLPPFGTCPDQYDDVDKDDNVLKCPAFFGDDGGRNIHPHGNNVLFADQHVAIFEEFDPQLMTCNPNIMQDWDAVSNNSTGG